jgi:hypothetical protein
LETIGNPVRWEHHWLGNHWEPNSWGASLETIRTRCPPLPKAKKIKINWALWSACWAIPLTWVQIWQFRTFVRHHFPLGIINNTPSEEECGYIDKARQGPQILPLKRFTGQVWQNLHRW